MLTGLFILSFLHSFNKHVWNGYYVIVDLPATACTPGIGPLPLLGHSPLGARAQDRRRTALKANKSHPPRRIAAETCQEERGGWVLNGAGVEGWGMSLCLLASY